MDVLEHLGNGDFTVRIYTGLAQIRNVRAENELIELAELGKQMQWVSVAERLPPLEKDIDIYTIDKKRLIDAWHIGNGRFLHGDIVFEREEVTHYMITPPNPKGAE